MEQEAKDNRSRVGTVGGWRPRHRRVLESTFRDGTWKILDIISVASVFFPMVVDRFFSQYLYFPILAYCIGILTLLSSDSDTEVAKSLYWKRNTLLLWIAGPATFLVLFMVFSMISTGDIEGVGPASSFLFVLPVLLLSGWIRTTLDSRSLQRLTRIWLAFSIVSSIGALFEWSTQTRVFESRVGIDVTRASFGQEHPIVLGTILCISLVLIREVKGFPKVVLGGLIILGIYCSDSLGPSIVAGLVLLVLGLLRGKVSLSFGRVRLIRAIVWMAVGLFLFLAFTQWSPVLNDTNIDQYNEQYRQGLYALIPDMLRSAPLGSGWNGPQQGSLFITSMWRGDMDISLTIDSEVVLLVAKFGIFGLLLWGALLERSVRSFSGSVTVALILFSLIANGLSVALSAWPGIVAVLGLLVGVSFGVCSEGSKGNVNRSAFTMVTHRSERQD